MLVKRPDRPPAERLNPTAQRTTRDHERHPDTATAHHKKISQSPTHNHTHRTVTPAQSLGEPDTTTKSNCPSRNRHHIQVTLPPSDIGNVISKLRQARPIIRIGIQDKIHKSILPNHLNPTRKNLKARPSNLESKIHNTHNPKTNSHPPRGLLLHAINNNRADTISLGGATVNKNTPNNTVVAIVVLRKHSANRLREKLHHSPLLGRNHSFRNIRPPHRSRIWRIVRRIRTMS